MTGSKAKTLVFPKTLGACVDRAYVLRAKRLEIEKEAAKTKAEEAAIKDYLISNFKKGDLEGAKGKVASCSLNPTTVASITDWDTFTAWVAKTKSWEMIQRKVNDKAYRERLDANKQVPGVEPFHVLKLNLTKK